MSNRKQCFTLSLQVFVKLNKNAFRCSNDIRHSPKHLQEQTTRGIFTFGNGKSLNARREYKATKLVGYSSEQMYSIVSDVGSYKNFLPFCKKSDVIERKENFLKGNLEIGFPPLIESYTSHVTLKQNEFVQAVCKDSRLFDHLITVWHFAPGIKEVPNTSVVTFYLSFQFKSLIYSQMANVIFNELVHKMENAFLKEARKRYGTATVATQTLTATNT
ncbi:coenzyme Q-binding protein COQ10 homolog A, mitochondrial [Planococcus citri]|uniref:coenzyme Q-binding protein COQ10 homolog A, mitochondrial n=1 Tax=Planococcus citri TaxID=170843 RepID=UPI0031F826A6